MRKSLFEKDILAYTSHKFFMCILLTSSRTVFLFHVGINSLL